MLKNQQRTSTTVKTKASRIGKTTALLALVAMGFFAIEQQQSATESAEAESTASTESSLSEQSAESFYGIEESAESSAATEQQASANAAESASSASAQQASSASSAASTASTVKWANVTASVENHAGKLVWSTLMEQNTDHFEIERSLDDLDYENLGSVRGAGKGKAFNRDYEFKDEDLGWVQMPRVYYRIKQVGTDGKSHLSDPIEYDFELDFGLYTRIEEGDNDQLNIRYAADFTGPVDLRILTLDGQIVEQRQLNADFDPQVTQLQTTDWNRGEYLLQLSNEAHALTEPFTLN
ncbi:MAG: hypothetical protein AAF587_28490 [Bacteroidota bacterium]